MESAPRKSYTFDAVAGSKGEDILSSNDVDNAPAKKQKAAGDAGAASKEIVVANTSGDDAKSPTVGVAYAARMSSGVGYNDTASSSKKQKVIKASSVDKKKRGKRIAAGAAITGGIAVMTPPRKPYSGQSKNHGGKKEKEWQRKPKTERQKKAKGCQRFTKNGRYLPPLDELKRHGIKTVTLDPQCLIRLAAGLLEDDKTSLVIKCEMSEGLGFLPTVEFGGNVYHIANDWCVMQPDIRMRKYTITKKDSNGHWVFHNEDLARLAICWYLLTSEEDFNESSWPFKNENWLLRAIQASDWTDGPAWPIRKDISVERKYMILRNAGCSDDFAVLRHVPYFDGVVEINFLQAPFTAWGTYFEVVANIPYYM